MYLNTSNTRIHIPHHALRCCTVHSPYASSPL